ncbi:MAG: TolC family protein [Methylovulum sp.]|nr:TolC family protein [Methylovulum sp.]
MPKLTNKQTLSLVVLMTLPYLSGIADDKFKLADNPAADAHVSGQSFTLAQAIDYALANNPDMQIAAERIGEAEAQLGVALSAFYPQVTARVGYESSNNPARVFAMIVAQRRFDSGSIANINQPGFHEDFRPEITGKMSLYRGGQDLYNSEAAKLGIRSAELEQSALHNALIQAVTASYYGYLAALEAHKIAQDSIAAINSELEQTRKRYAAGTVLKSDVLSLEVQLADAQSAEIRTANGIELAQTSMATLLGKSAHQAFTIAPSANLPKPVLATAFNALLDQALVQRPEIKAAATQVAISEKQLKSEQGAYLPRADAFVSYGQNSAEPGFSANRDNVTVGVAVEMDLFSGFSTQQRVSAATRKAAEARETERKIKLVIEQEVRTAYLQLEEALARLHVAETSVAASDEALRLVNEQRRAEVVTVTRYLESEVARNKAHSNTIAARYDALSAEAALKKAIGAWK